MVIIKKESMKTNQKGFSVVELIVVFVVIGLIGAASWYVYDKQKGGTEDVATNTASTENTYSETSTNESVKKVDDIKYSVPADWQNAKQPYEPFGADGQYLLSPDYKEAGAGQLYIEDGAFISFQDTEWVAIKSNTNVEQAVGILKNTEGAYIDPSSVKTTNIGGKQVIIFDAGHTTDGVTVLYKTADSRWLEASFSTVSGDNSEYTAQDSSHYETFLSWLDEFVELN